MPYCMECGENVEKDARFCPSCGTNLQIEDEETVEESIDKGTEPTTETADTTKREGIDTGRAILSGVMGIIVGSVVAFAFTNTGVSFILFLITVIGVGYFIYTSQETVRLAVGMGLYITALWMPLAPIIFYIPLAFGANQNTAVGTGQVVGSVVGMAIYGFIGLLIGLVLAAIGYFLRRGERE